MIVELLTPNVAQALSSGPVQPEITSFEPVGTTDMVDLFTGDFVYNIPLMDVEGYPVNISYHGGVTMDQEASWVGLGWNINPGAVNRAVRGLPDEFKGELIEKELSIKPEITKKIGIGTVGEIFGLGQPKLNISGSLGGYLNISNYRGVSVDFTSSIGVNAKLGILMGGFNLGAGVGSQAGATLNYDKHIGVGISSAVGKELTVGGNFNYSESGVYSPRRGLKKYESYNLTLTAKSNSGNSASMSTGTTIPVGLQNYTAAITNASYMNSGAGQLKVGPEAFWLFGSGKVSGSYSKISYEPNGSRKGYGYFNLSEATDNDLTDFSRDKDGLYNSTMSLLPHTVLTYDVYSVNGQGTGGSFRPFRNDIGSVYDPYTRSENKDFEGVGEGGAGNLFSLGGEKTDTKTTAESGPWKETDAYRPFLPKRGGKIEDIYFKEAGELTENNENYLNNFANTDVIKPDDVGKLPLYKAGSERRVVRSNHIYTITGAAEDTALLLEGQKIVSYTDSTGFKNYPSINKETIDRVTADTSKQLRRRENQVTQIVQNQKDGRRYVYGLPVVNHVQREATFSVDPESAENNLDESKYLIGYSEGVDDSKGNTKGLERYYSSTVTPTYVTAHLLTSVLSADYIDVTGNGVSDDDLGTYTKFNYSRKSRDYRWRSPIRSGKAQYSPGYQIDKQDDKGSYVIGSREQWMLHSIETKNYVAEFFVSPRQDAQGVLDRILKGGLSDAYKQAPYDEALPADTKENKSYKLDSIVLYNKHDRFAKNANATPIKTILFTYDYSLCKNAPNSAAGLGKLTLKKLQVRYGKSNLNMSAAYKFTYSALNPDYDEAATDRWGMYKPNDDGQLNNFRFPFTKQTAETDGYAAAWSLTEIGLPSGGVIKPEYESDDYAFVQNREAMEMFRVAGFGRTEMYIPSDKLYLNRDNPNLFIYFKRRKDAENKLLGPRDNYLKGTNLLYYTVPVELAPGKFEPIKGYADVMNIGYCQGNDDYGFVMVRPRILEKSLDLVNPVMFTAMNTGRYNLPHIIFPGSDPESTDMGNIIDGLKGSIKEMFQMASNPLSNMMDESRAQRADYTRSFIRLTSPGLKKKGGGHRVKAIRFYDSWEAMAGGNEAVYGKTYSYTLKRDDGKGVISSGVASYEPMTGGDELPQREPVNFIAQDRNKFPPNDAVELYLEMPVGESFYPSPLVGYSNVVVSSIHKDVGRSSQTEDISGFYTAKDFPIQAVAGPINRPDPVKKIGLTESLIEESASQGFAFVFNDMHGKPRNTEHWVLKPVDTVRGRELVTMQKYDYLIKDGKIDNVIPAFEYHPAAGKLSVGSHRVGMETDFTMDTRLRKEETKARSFSFNVNTSLIFLVTIPIPFGYPFTYENKVNFKCATTTKVTQQYGILSKVTSTNEGAVTEVRNEVFDYQTGNALVTSVNNEFKEREYTVSYPAHWAYKELGPCYINHDARGTFANDLFIDSLGSELAGKFVNYNPAYSTNYRLPSNMPVARIMISEDMPNYKLGDELLVSLDGNSAPIRMWTMGYTADVYYCYLVLAPREPYKMGVPWTFKTKYEKVKYRVVKSGQKNRLEETIQTFTTTDRSNIFPFLKDTLKNLVNLNAQEYKFNLNQVFAANMISDSLNPFVTGKVGLYRPDQQVISLKNRSYNGLTARNSGMFASQSYWKTELDNYAAYCPDSFICTDCTPPDTGMCTTAIGQFSVQHVGTDKFDDPEGIYYGGVAIKGDDRYIYMMDGIDTIKVKFTPSLNPPCDSQSFIINDLSGAYVTGFLPQTFKFKTSAPDSFTFIVGRSKFGTRFDITIKDACCWDRWSVKGDMTDTNYMIGSRMTHPGSGLPVTMRNVFVNSPTYVRPSSTTLMRQPTYIREKILLGAVGHYPFTDDELWLKTQQVTKYNWFGQELENKEEGLGYNAAIYGYNQQLPVCVAKNARHSDVLYEGFEDYELLKSRPDKNASYMPLLYSPFEPFFSGASILDQFYKISSLTASGISAAITKVEAHTGNYAIRVDATADVPLNAAAAGMAKTFSFKMVAPRKYVASVWIKTTTPITDARTGYVPNNLTMLMDTVTSETAPSSAALKSFPLKAMTNLIEGWQKFEIVFEAPAAYKTFKLRLNAGYYYDDLRIYPFESNSKGFVYDPVTRKLMATLDENNFATFYEYDTEGNLVRTKKETEKGILTITESRSSHRKVN